MKLHRRNNSGLNLEQLNTIFEFPFEAIFDVQEAKEEFRLYLKKEHNEEPFMFFEHVEEFKRLKFEENKTKKAISILKTFILPSSQHEINISSQQRQVILQEFEKASQLSNEKHLLVSESIFDEVQLSVFYSLKNDNYPRFTSSAQFKNFLKHKDVAFISSIAVKKSTKYMEYIPKFDGLINDRDITFFSFMSSNEEMDVWDEIKVAKGGKRACYISKKEFQFNDKSIEGMVEQHHLKANGKLLKQVFILPCTKEEAFTVFSHTHLRKEIMGLEAINQIDFVPISPQNKYAHSIIHIQLNMKGFSWVLKPRDAVLALTSVMDTKRGCSAILLKSTESTSMPEKKTHVRAQMFTTGFFSDCSPNDQILSFKKQKKLHHDSEGSQHKIGGIGGHGNSSSTSSTSGNGIGHSTNSAHNTSSSSLSRKSSASSEETDSSESFENVEHACKLVLVTFVDFKTLQSDFIRKKIINVKNKHSHENFLNAIREQRQYGFKRPKFSEGLLDTFDAFKSTYLADPHAEITWNMDEEDDAETSSFMHELIH